MDFGASVIRVWVPWRALLKAILSSAPTSAERFSGWIAAAWVASALISDNQASPIARAFASVGPEYVWIGILATLATLQLGGSVLRLKRTRIVGCMLAIGFWLFLGAEVGLMSNFTAPGWIVFVILAWSQIATLGSLAGEERRR